LALVSHPAESVQLTRRRLDVQLSPSDVLLALREDAAPFALMGRWLGSRALVGSRPLVVHEGSEAPFDAISGAGVPGAAGAVGGGWVGYLGFGVGCEIERLPPPPPRPEPLALSRFAYYDNVLRLDEDGRWWFEALASEERQAALSERLDELSARLSDLPESRPWRVDRLAVRPPGYEGHRAAIATCLERIRAGEIYQANLCLRFEGELLGEAIDAFAETAPALDAPYAAFLGLDDAAVMSFSPELFLRRTGRHVTTAPIKGTARRSADPREAEAQREALARSEKDHAENVMIVDLMRNDLGRVCAFGTVEADRAPTVEAHPGVWHLVSHVRGELAEGAHDGDLLRATFPPGSVTGAPKIQSLKVISRLEASAREVYTGAIGMISPAAGLELSVAIRTFEVRGDRIWLGAGGGIVADSEPDEEVREAWRKASPLAAALGAEIEPPQPRKTPAVPIEVLRGPRPEPASGVFETVAVRDGQPVRLARHLARLSGSVEALYGTTLPQDLEARIRAEAEHRDAARLRICTRPGGTELEWNPVGEAPPVVELEPVRLAGGLGAHKWLDRRLVDGLSDGRRSPLFVDLDDNVLETGWANAWLVDGDRLLTPPADGRLLPGVTRDALLRQAGLTAREEPLTLDRVKAAGYVLLTSSIRLVTIGSLGGSEPPPPQLTVRAGQLRELLR
jgi:para-aminobenzoate synthetase / 4-amino-4-deoxychorismate lyase